MEKILDDVRRDAIAWLKASEENVEVLAEAADRIMRFGEESRKQGLLILEYYVENEESEFLKFVTMLVVDAVERESVIEFATNAYWANRPEGVQAMVDYIYLRGMLCVQQGDSPRVIQEILQSLMPLNLRSEFKKQMDSKRQCRKELVEEYSRIRPAFQDTTALEEIHVLEEMVRFMDARSLQRVLFDMDANDLAACVYALGPELREKIMDNVSSRYADIIMDRVVHCYQIHHDEWKVRGIVRSMIGTAKQLDEKGEIILRKWEDE